MDRTAARPPSMPTAHGAPTGAVSHRLAAFAFALAFAAAGLAGHAAPAEAQGSAPAAAQGSAPAATARAIFAGGCFWCVEADFDKVPGVLSTTSGYIGGRTPNPTYEQVSRNTTGHAEAVEIAFDPTKVSYETLLAKYWRTIDPTTVDRQFCDTGSPYRTAIFATDAAHLEAARRSLAEVQRTKPFAEPIVTRIEQAGPFYPAEAYHQDYYLKNPVRYRYYRSSCGRDARLEALWGRP